MPSLSRIGSLLVLAICSLLISGCRRTEILPAATLPPPTLTPTPFSTALPTVEPASHLRVGKHVPTRWSSCRQPAAPTMAAIYKTI